ncbi:MAG TPA: hypothetical protein VHW00_19925 [Thermoanaerobaculia bacterium]|nr:hypothetical protein [Thermoanaerobaculia bacterium]
MTLVTRTILMLMLTAALTFGAYAQETSAPSASEATETTATTTSSSKRTDGERTDGEAERPVREVQSSHETRNQFFTLLQQHPPELGTILSLDPTLLSNDAFLAGYPELAKFVSEHPEVRRNPRFFLDNYVERRSNTLDDVLEGIFILSMFIFFAFVLSWLLRTIIEQRRWSRLSRTQTEVHNKILDRFGTSTELLEYMKTPAGTKFLESAPIPLRETPSQNASLSRVLWSIQVGIVVAAGAVGMLLVSNRFDKESSQGLFAIGVIGLCIGAGFVASAIVSIVVSRRLAAWQGGESAAIAESGPVR